MLETEHRVFERRNHFQRRRQIIQVFRPAAPQAQPLYCPFHVQAVPECLAQNAPHFRIVRKKRHCIQPVVDFADIKRRCRQPLRQQPPADAGNRPVHHPQQADAPCRRWIKQFQALARRRVDFHNFVFIHAPRRFNSRQTPLLRIFDIFKKRSRRHDFRFGKIAEHVKRLHLIRFQQRCQRAFKVEPGFRPDRQTLAIFRKQAEEIRQFQKPVGNQHFRRVKPRQRSCQNRMRRHVSGFQRLQKKRPG